MKHLITICSFVLILITGHFCSLNQPPKSICNIIENVERRIPVGSNTGLTEKEFNKVLDDFTKVYAPIVKEKGYRLSIDRKWSSDTINASTTVSGDKWIIYAYGGLARYPSMDSDTYLAVMLHEIGHHLGGYPARGWASNEGQSDYYATLKGMRIMRDAGYKFKNNINNSVIPESVVKKCTIQHKTTNDIQFCVKSAAVGHALASVLNSLQNSSVPVDFDKESGPKVDKTNNNHPKAQCRLHTYLNGAICGASHLEEFSMDSPGPGACAEEKGDIIGVRDRCWYKPKE